MRGPDISLDEQEGDTSSKPILCDFSARLGFDGRLRPLRGFLLAAGFFGTCCFLGFLTARIGGCGFSTEI